MHPFLTDQLANARLADIHAEFRHRHAIRAADPGRGWRLWRRPRPGPPPPPIALPTRNSEPAETLDSTLRPVA